MQARMKEVRSRAAVRSWEYRQRNHAAGVWGRLRRLLAGAEWAFVVPPEAAEALLAEGLTPHGVGAELDPPRTILLLPRERASAIAGAREIAVRMSAELLAARFLVLVPFP
jgi:hypothetical protein